LSFLGSLIFYLEKVSSILNFILSTGLFRPENFQFTEPIWWVSQVFALICLVFFIWCFQVRNKVKMMALTGIGCLAFSISAALLQNYAISGLFFLAAVRNFVFSYFDWRVAKGKRMDKWLYLFFCGFFIVATVTSTIVLNLMPVLNALGVEYRITPIWLEVVICTTLVGLIVGNILDGTNVMRVSFIINRIFTIINHLIVGNLIGMIIAICAITSNLVYYIKLFRDIKKGRLRKDYHKNLDDHSLQNADAADVKQEQSESVLIEGAIAVMESES